MGDEIEPGSWVLTGINPIPWRAPEVSVGKKGGKFVPRVYKHETVRAYQEAVADEIRRAYEPTPSTCELEVEFYFWRQLDSPNSKKVDATNLQKSTEDALHGLLFENDQKVQRVTSTIVEQSDGVEPLIVIAFKPYRGLPKGREFLHNIHRSLLTVKKLHPSNDSGVDPEGLF